MISDDISSVFGKARDKFSLTFEDNNLVFKFDGRVLGIHDIEFKQVAFEAWRGLPYVTLAKHDKEKIELILRDLEALSVRFGVSRVNLFKLVLDSIDSMDFQRFYQSRSADFIKDEAYRRAMLSYSYLFDPEYSDDRILEYSSSSDSLANQLIQELSSPSSASSSFSRTINPALEGVVEAREYVSPKSRSRSKCKPPALTTVIDKGADDNVILPLREEHPYFPYEDFRELKDWEVSDLDKHPSCFNMFYEPEFLNSFLSILKLLLSKKKYNLRQTLTDVDSVVDSSYLRELYLYPHHIRNSDGGWVYDIAIKTLDFFAILTLNSGKTGTGYLCYVEHPSVGFKGMSIPVASSYVRELSSCVDKYRDGVMKRYSKVIYDDISKNNYYVYKLPLASDKFKYVFSVIKFYTSSYFKEPIQYEDVSEIWVSTASCYNIYIYSTICMTILGVRVYIVTYLNPKNIHEVKTAVYIPVNRNGVVYFKHWAVNYEEVDYGNVYRVEGYDCVSDVIYEDFSLTSYVRTMGKDGAERFTDEVIPSIEAHVKELVRMFAYSDKYLK